LTVPPFAGNVAASGRGRVFAAAGASATVGSPRRAIESPRRALIGAGGWHRGLIDSALGGSVFTYALIASLAFHGVLLAVKFRAIELAKMQDRAPPLEVALVNAKSTAKPVKADILAQANLEGGGNTDANRRAKTPLPVLPKERQSSEIAGVTQRVEKLERQTKELMTQMQGAPVVPETPAPAPAPVEPAERSGVPSATELMQKTLEVMRLEAQIAKDMDAYQKRPRRKHLGASAEEYRFARYVEDWRLKVERVGNLNYPEAARQMKLYGNLILTVSIRTDGSVEKVTIDRSSGRKVLDAAAIKIVEMAAPYAPFPPDIQRDTDILDITRTWTFAKGDELKSE
jgi:protein TonB